jgi:hypothetical protein
MPEIRCGHIKTAIFRCELSDYHLEWKSVINVEIERGGTSKKGKIPGVS